MGKRKYYKDKETGFTYPGCSKKDVCKMFEIPIKRLKRVK